MKYHIVYETKNTVNGKIYVGKHSTNNLDDGYLGTGTQIRHAIKKYGKEAFTRTILHFCNDETEAYRIEEQLITVDFVNRLDTYNIHVGGLGGAKGLVLSPDHKAKIGKSNSISLKGKKHTEDTKRKMQQWHTGREKSHSAKVNMSAAQKGKVLSEQTRSKISNTLKGKPLSPETRQAMSVARTGKPWSLERRAKFEAKKAQENNSNK